MPAKNNPNTIRRLIILGIFLALVVVAFLLVRPFIVPILTALVLAYLLRPVYVKLNQKLKRPNLTALLICIFIVLILLAFIWFVAQITLREVINFYTYTQTRDIAAPIKAFFFKVSQTEQFSSQIGVLTDKAIAKGAEFLLDAINTVLTNLPLLILQFFVLFFILFYFLRDAESITTYFRNLILFKKAAQEKFLVRFKDVTAGVIYGMVIVGILQGAVAGIGYYVFGVGQPFLLMLVSMLLSILPFIGAWLIWLPVGITMLLGGQTAAGIGLLLYGLIVVSNIDNLIRPYFVGKKAKMSNAIALLGMLGGLQLFGLIGLIIGPIILDYVIIFIEFYRTKKIRELA